jgi:hypothetical protein
MIKWLKKVYGEMRISRGNVHNYLGMNLNVESPGEVKVTMIDYLKEVTNDFPEVITRSAATTATDHMFEIHPDESRVLLDKKWAQAFHHTVAQLLFVSNRTRKDIHMTITFLTTSV